MPDVVYIVKASHTNEELRYSIRSLKNLPHDKVWFAGFMPRWVQNVHHIPTNQIVGQKHENSLSNQRAALRHRGVSDTFYLMNDDHFIMKPIDHMPRIVWGPNLDYAINNCTTLGDSFKFSMETTRDILRSMGASELNYQLHIPCVINKRDMRECMEQIPTPHTNGAYLHHVTLCMNLYGWEPEGMYMSDVKVHDIYQMPEDIDTYTFLSTSDRSFTYGNVGNYIRSRFPEPSIYER